MGKRNHVEPQEIFLGAWLKLKGIGATEAARIAGCTQSYISNISGGVKNNVNALYLLKLSDHMGITVNDLFRKPPSEAQIAALSEFSPQARESLLKSKRKIAR
ncbi:helix-turn-helix transcriptional regulator [Bradyrhizobium sp. INPA03-11B]|uniref:helix-turn-helix domain-containing protein n=1 Tax=Bradyrhizobium sp. INPA03-11B TaxID=418598 RepID=UPI00338E4B08